MSQFFRQIISEIISVIAGFIIAVGIIQVPVIPEYKIPQHKISEISQEIKSATTTPLAATSTPLKKKQAEKLPAPKISIPQKNQTPEISQAPPEITIPIPTPTPIPTISLTELNKKIRSAVVNIICANKTSGYLKPITGSGIIVSPKGIILTTAHIGQYFLLENLEETGYLECDIRNGNIAQPAYKAKLVYIPSIWIEQNAETIIQQEPMGTGENDFAFLLITESNVQGKELPLSFDFSEPNFEFDYLPPDLSTLIASYPAGFLGGISVQKNLGLTSTFAPIKALYAFSEKEPMNLDIFALGGNIAAQGGSSGGAVVDTRDGKLLGIIVTSTEATTTASRILNVITLPYIKRSFEKYTGFALPNFLNSNLDFISQFFSQTEFNRLKNLLIDQIISLQ